MRRSFPLFLAAALLLLVLLSMVVIPLQAARRFGSPNPKLGFLTTLKYSVRLLWHDGLLTTPRDRNGGEHSIRIEPGEPVSQIARQLEQSGIISSAAAFYDYMVYTGMDLTIQAGDYKLSPALTIIEISRELQDATPEEVSFVILPGWRLEEIANSMPTSGLAVTTQEFLAEAYRRPTFLEFLPAQATSEGFLYPEAYLLPRSTAADELINIFIRNFSLRITPELKDGFASQDLDEFQAIILASLVEREAVKGEEKPLIASVFLNRLRVGLKLDSDATVQYAIGFNPDKNTWWTNPLSAVDLQINSSYNTYIHSGLPPGPIANPGADAIRSVAFPAETPYFYFQARCDGSGFHVFAQTFEEHLQNTCP